jgi:tetratricopeptide (TPR) repeat protein
MYEDAKNKLQKGQYTEALRILEKCLEIDSGLNKGRIYVSWARLAAKGSGPQKATVLKEVEVDMMQVPPEEKLEAIYSFVMGIYYKVKGELGFAKKSFEKAVHLDGDMIVARRELNVLLNLESKNQKNNDVLSADLKELVSNFFRKK